MKNGDFKNGRWTQEEHKRFIESILKYGNEWKKVEQYIGTRSSTQARSHAQKFFEKMKIANLIGEEVDLDNKTSIKALHATLKHMEKEQYLDTVEDINGIPFERKKSSTKGIRNKNKANNEGIPENFGDLDLHSVTESKKTIFINEENLDEKENNSITTTETKKEVKAINLIDELSIQVEISSNGNNGNNNIINTNSNTNTNKLLKKKRVRNFSYNSIDINRYNFDFDDSEIDDFDFQNILVEMFEQTTGKGKKEKEDFGDSERIFYLENDFDRDYQITCEIKHGDELFDEYLA